MNARNEPRDASEYSSRPAPKRDADTELTGRVMEMHQIRYFLAVGSELNFSRAAEACNVSQPALSRAIKLFELELGGQLFHREGKQTRLTELGLMMRPYFLELFKQSVSAQEAASSFNKKTKDKIALGVMCTIPPDQFVPLVAAVHRRHPNIDIKLVDGTGRALNEKLIRGDLDVAIFCTGLDQPDSRLNAIRLFSEPMVIALRRDHPLAAGCEIEMKNLNGMRYIQRVNCEFTGQVSPIMRAKGVDIDVAYQSDRDDWILSMVAAGFGFGFMPQGCANTDAVAALRLINPAIWRDVNLATVRGRAYSPAIGVLVREAMRLEWLGASAKSAQTSARGSALGNETRAARRRPRQAAPLRSRAKIVV